MNGGIPKSSILMGFLPYKPTIFGYPNLFKPPNSSSGHTTAGATTVSPPSAMHLQPDLDGDSWILGPSEHQTGPSASRERLKSIVISLNYLSFSSELVDHGIFVTLQGRMMESVASMDWS